MTIALISLGCVALVLSLYLVDHVESVECVCGQRHKVHGCQTIRCKCGLTLFRRL